MSTCPADAHIPAEQQVWLLNFPELSAFNGSIGNNKALPTVKHTMPGALLLMTPPLPTAGSRHTRIF